MHATVKAKHKVKYTKFQSIVKKKLVQNDMRQWVLAEKLHISKPHLAKVLKGQRKSYTIAKAICDMFDIPYSIYKGLPEYLQRCRATGKQVGQRTLYSKKQTNQASKC